MPGHAFFSCFIKSPGHIGHFFVERPLLRQEISHAPWSSPSFQFQQCALLGGLDLHSVQWDLGRYFQMSKQEFCSIPVVLLSLLPPHTAMGLGRKTLVKLGRKSHNRFFFILGWDFFFLELNVDTVKIWVGVLTIRNLIKMRSSLS